MRKQTNVDEIYRNAERILARRDDLIKDDIDTDQKKKIMDEMVKEITEFCNLLGMTMLKGIGSVISAFNQYKVILDELKQLSADDMKNYKMKTAALGCLDDRIKDKLYERLYPEDLEYVYRRFNMANVLYNRFEEKMNKIFEAYGIEEEINTSGNIYIYEEDFESITLKRILETKGIDKFKCFVSDKDVFKLADYRIRSFKEAGIGEKDLLLIPSRRYIREYDKKLAIENGVKNILEVNIFDDRNSDFYDTLPAEHKENEEKMGFFLAE